MAEKTRIELMFWDTDNERELEERLAQIKQALPASRLVWRLEDWEKGIVWADFEVNPEDVPDWIRGFHGIEWSRSVDVLPADDFELENEFLGA